MPICEAILRTFDADHWHPRDLLGKTDLANLQLLCHPCHVERAGPGHQGNSAHPPAQGRPEEEQAVDPLPRLRPSP